MQARSAPAGRGSGIGSSRRPCAGRAARQAPRSSCSAAAARTDTVTTTTTPATPSRDASADILQAVMGLALKRRLREYESVDTRVSCDALGLLDGRFNAMSIRGRHWLTPLAMTAHMLEVQIGAMQVDLNTLLWERRVAMRNVPLGAVTIHLSGKDMGNFVSHPLFQQAAATAVQGHAFVWDRDSVTIDHQRGHVLFSGRWAGNGQRYRILMRPGGGSSGGGGDGSGGGGSGDSIRRPPLQVGAQLLQRDGSPAPISVAADARAAKAVAAGMANFFTNMQLDLQGIEIRNPVLLLHPGNTSKRGEGDLLEICMKLRLRALPPMDMQF